MFTMNRAPQAQLPPTPVVWLDADTRVEYRIDIADALTVEQLNKLGQDGWILCAVLPKQTENAYYFRRSI